METNVLCDKKPANCQTSGYLGVKRELSRMLKREIKKHHFDSADMCIPFEEEEPCPVGACLSMKCNGGTDSDQILTRTELMMTITLLG